MARFRNPAFSGVSDVLSQIQQTRLQAPMLEGKLRGLVAQARAANAGAALDEQTQGSRASIGDLFAGAGQAAESGEPINPSALMLRATGNMLGGENNAAIGNIGEILSSVGGVPSVAGEMAPEERDNLFVGTGTQDADDTFTGLGDVLANKRAIASMRGGGGGASGGGSAGGGNPGFTLTSGGRSFIERNIRRMLDAQGAEGFEGANGIISDAVAAAERAAQERGLTENEAIKLVLDALNVEEPVPDETMWDFTDTSEPGKVSLGDLFVTPAPTVEPGADGAVAGDTDPAPPTDAPAPPGGAGDMTEEQVLEEARAAIRAGKDRGAVMTRVKELGFDPRKL